MRSDRLFGVVVILCALIGYGAATFAGVASGLLYGVLAGFVVAPFVPLPAAGE